MPLILITAAFVRTLSTETELFNRETVALPVVKLVLGSLKLRI
ncbi:hypothetical protein Pan241w_53030 [Gimesia alba]|uniref:Uncharacterized protein n=1 Tax=Gimesia alba TaxID=2527973 RepID=A0A517RMU4_9PLAN|nr:hypothetical protein Pan241w_53030 [Gimesia alba]